MRMAAWKKDVGFLLVSFTCLLFFALKLRGGGSMTISKKLAIRGKVKEIEDDLKKVNPNKTQDHQHFGSIFEPEDTSG